MFFNVACNYFMLKADVIMLLTMHVSIEPIVQSRQLQWPILLKVSVRWYNHGAITCKRRNLNIISIADLS